jgi:uncharacterized repeat protein (TIGR03803 family)
MAGLVRDPAGNLYGTTTAGGNWGGGTVFKLDTDGTEEIIVNFGKKVGDALYPEAGALLAAGGHLYGTTGSGGSSNFGTIYEVVKSQAVVVFSFAGTAGERPWAGLIKDSAGNFYGTTGAGGDLTCHNNGGYGCGTVFKLDSAGTETILYSFRGTPDGYAPSGGLVMDEGGNLYGITPLGGTGKCEGNPPQTGCGTIFEIDPKGKETVLYNFKGGADGKYPLGSLVRDSAGNLYGTAGNGGRSNSRCSDYGCGTVFKLTPAGR